MRKIGIILVVLVAGACSSKHVRGDADLDTLIDDSTTHDTVEDGTADPLHDGADVADVPDDDVADIAEEDPIEEVVLPPVEEMPACGNRIVEEGEECDDGNRLNGDGCDWECQLGDGDPPPEPDPSVTDYVPSGDPVIIEDAYSDQNQRERLPLVWTGSEYASAWATRPEWPDTAGVEFRRFGTDGVTIDTPWRYDVAAYAGGLDLVWHGSGFGLFYVDIARGVMFMALDDKGKPVGSPVVVDADTRARAPAADVTDDGYVVAWVREMGDATGWSWCCSTDDDVLKIRLIDRAGGATGPLVIVDDAAQGPPDVATGEDGFGLVYPVHDSFGEGSAYCGFRFLRTDPTLSDWTSSGVLGRAGSGDVKWLDDRWVTSWNACSPCEWDEEMNYLTVATFSADGSLAGPPAMNAPLNSDRSPIRLDAGDGGLVLAWGSHGGSLGYLRTDADGVAVGPVHDIIHHDTPHHYGAFSVAWSGGAFGILYVVDSPSEITGLYLRHFVAVE